MLSVPVMSETLLTNSAYDAAIHKWEKTQVSFKNGTTKPFSGCQNLYHDLINYGPVKNFENKNGNEFKEPDREIIISVANECFILNSLRNRHYTRTSKNDALDMNKVILTYPATMILAISPEEARRKESVAKNFTLKQYDPSLSVYSKNEIIDSKYTIYQFSSLGKYKNSKNKIQLIKLINYSGDGGSFKNTSYYYVTKHDNDVSQAKELSVFKLE